MKTEESKPEIKPAPRKQAFVALQHRDYRLLWSSQFISVIGTQMRLVGIGWQVYLLTKDPLLLGLIGLCRVVPLVLCSLVGGPAADALDRRKLLLVTQFILLLSSAALAIVTTLGWINIWWIYGITILTACANAFDRPAYSALIPAIVPRQHLGNAISLNVLNFQMGTVLGPAITGFMIAGFGVQGVYWVDAASYVAVIVALLLISYRPLAPSGQRVSLQAALEGLRYVLGSRVLISCMLLDFFVTLFGTAHLMLPILAVEVLHTDALGYGILSASDSIGAVIMSAILAWVNLNRVRRPGWVLLGAVVCYALSVIAFGISNIFVLSVLFLAIAGATDTVSMSLRHTISQLTTPDELRGRMQSVNMIFFAGGPQLGELRAGLMTQLGGVQFALAGGGVMCFIVVLVIGRVSRSLREFEFDK